MLDTARRTCFTEDHQLFREQVRKFFERELTPHLERWEAAEIVDRDFWNKCGEAGSSAPPCRRNMEGSGSTSAIMP
jgi:alkylation response protein AidB-like acyl-CoA dehydrogenase